MATEDFTFEFPITTTTPPPPSVDSTPWWCVTSSSSGHENPENKEANGENEGVEGSIKAESEGGGNIGDGEEEEKMDLLWEDFNEEMSRNCGLVVESDVSRWRAVGLGRGKAFKLAKAGGGRRLSIVMFLKVLKKLFVLHNSQRSLKKGVNVVI